MKVPCRRTTIIQSGVVAREGRAEPLRWPFIGDVPSANVFDSVFDRLPVTGAPRTDAAGLVPGDARVAAGFARLADAAAARVGGRIAGGAEGGEAEREEEKEHPEIEESKRGEAFQGSRLFL